MNDVALTTFDNPFDPFTELSDWNKFDCQKNYNTCSIIARKYNYYLSSNGLDEETLTDNEIRSIYELVLDEIIKFDPRNIYKKVYRT